MWPQTKRCHHLGLPTHPMALLPLSESCPKFSPWLPCSYVISRSPAHVLPQGLCTFCSLSQECCSLHVRMALTSLHSRGK